MTPGALRDTSKATEIPIVPPVQSSRKIGHIAVPSQVFPTSTSGKSDRLPGCPSPSMHDGARSIDPERTPFEPVPVSLSTRI